MDKEQLYNSITDRKIKPRDFEQYDGNNGRVNKCVELFRQGVLKTGGTLLDVGGGIGDLGCALNNAFDRRICLDISKKNLEAAQVKGNEPLKADVDQFGISCEDETINVVTALDFIEHIIDPEYFARECFRVLKPSGQVFINTPNIRFWKHIQELWLYGAFPHTSGDREVFHGGHLAFFCKKDLEYIFGAAGFKNFVQIKDEECYEQPLEGYYKPILGPASSQQDYVNIMLELGCPNLLFKCEK